jgi:nucleotide-binding universal stress UspA family protein
VRAVRIKRVIAGTSGSPGSLAALRYAEGLARAHGAILVPVLAWESAGGDGYGTLQSAGYLRQGWREIACQRMREALLAVWGQQPHDPWIQPRVERGPAGWVLVRVAHDTGDVLVLGAGRRGPLQRITRRRVSRYCAARAQCPVILVPPPELTRQAGLRQLAWQLTHRTVTAEQIVGSRSASSISCA